MLHRLIPLHIMVLIPAWTGLGFSVYNIYHNMTNAIGDGIANGPVMLLYGVNPNNPDVAQDGLGTGWKILNNQVRACIGERMIPRVIHKPMMILR